MIEQIDPEARKNLIVVVDTYNAQRAATIAARSKLPRALKVNRATRRREAALARHAKKDGA